MRNVGEERVFRVIFRDSGRFWPKTGYGRPKLKSCAYRLLTPIPGLSVRIAKKNAFPAGAVFYTTLAEVISAGKPAVSAKCGKRTRFSGDFPRFWAI